MFRTRLMRVFTVFLLCLSVVTLTRAASAMEAMEYKGYINKVFGYTFQYPDIFFDGTFEEDGGEVVMESIHKKYLLKAWGRELKGKENAKSLLKSLKKDFEKNGNVTLKHSEKLGKNAFSIGYTDPDNRDVLMAQCCVVNGRRAAFFVFRYPHDEYEVFGDILSRMAKSFEVF